MSDEGQAPRDPADGSTADGSTADDGGDGVAFLPIGIVFLVLGLVGLLNDTMRYAAFAFLPVGVSFLVLGLQGRKDDADAAEAGPGDPPDVTPR